MYKILYCVALVLISIHKLSPPIEQVYQTTRTDPKYDQYASVVARNVSI